MTTLTHQINAYLEYCSTRKHLNQKTIKAYRIDLHQYALFVSDSTDYFSKNTVDSFLTHLHKQYKTKTIPFHSIQTFLSTLYTQKEQASSPYQMHCPFAIAPLQCLLKYILHTLQLIYFPGNNQFQLARRLPKPLNQ